VDGLAKLNREVQELAEVLNSPTLDSGTVENPAVPVAWLMKRTAGSLYVLAVAMRDAPTEVRFKVSGASGAPVKVRGEERTIPLEGDEFDDAFGPYAVHLCEIPAATDTKGPSAPTGLRILTIT
jgi:hypothetical protein